MYRITKQQIFSILLYLLPIMFFIVSYFLITTSGEDTFQGAENFRHTSVDIINDSISAFNYNGRLTDMYAWSVIDLFDYQFSFGPDIVFRIIDVLLASGVFYLITYIIINRKPKLIIKDALIYCASFLIFILSPFGFSFYSGFSIIHNYVTLAFILLLFFVPFLRLFSGKKFRHPIIINLFFPLLGIIFGMSSTITPIAFLLTIAIYCIFKRQKLPSLPLWFFTGLAGLIIGFCVSFFFGPGVSHYTDVTAAANNFNYIPISDIFTNPLSTIFQLTRHTFHNFLIVLAPLLAYFCICLIFAKKPRFSNFKHSKGLVLSLLFFIFIHTIATLQISAPARLLSPAYLAGIVLILKLFSPTINSKILTTIIPISTTIIIIIHTVFLIQYRTKISIVLEEIKASTDNNICIEYERIKSPNLPLIKLGQEDFLVDWGTPQTIYQKNVTICE